jgi:uncharacterized phage-associated protein
MLKFPVDAEKVVNAIMFFAGRCSNPTKMKISKLMFYSDKIHLNRYGRPITGDTYIKMKFGPVPSMALNLMRRQAYYENASELFDQSLTIKGNEVKTLREYDRRVFSGSDISVMEEVLLKYGCHSAFVLSDVSHTESAWNESEINRKIDFEKFFSADEDSQAMLQLITSEEVELENCSLDATSVRARG